MQRGEERWRKVKKGGKGWGGVEGGEERRKGVKKGEGWKEVKEGEKG